MNNIKITSPIGVMKLALEALEELNGMAQFFPNELYSYHPSVMKATQAITALRQAIALQEGLVEQAQQAEPVAMKFKIYKPTVPDPVRQGINNALLPWVYDQDRSSGFDASMWVTPVATLPLPRQPLTDEEINKLREKHGVTSNGRGIKEWTQVVGFVRAIEAAHGIKENT